MNSAADKRYHIFLIGFMGAGKSTVALKLKEKLRAVQIEMDQQIVEEQKMPIAEIFRQYGEEHFRDLESELLGKLKNTERAVVSCGGGVVIREANVKTMKESGYVVLLTADPETIYQRVKDSQERPILNQNMSVAYISELMEARRPRYEAAADLIVSTDGKNVEAICDEIIKKLDEKNSQTLA